METHDVKVKGVNIAAEDIREGIVGVLSIFVREPMFQGQTKERLNNPDMNSKVDNFVGPALEAVAEALSGAEHQAKIDARLTAQSRARIERLRHHSREIEKIDPPPLDVIGCREHHALAAEIRARIDEVKA